MKQGILVGGLLLALSGCSSIVSKSEYSVAIASNPAEANFTIVNKSGRQVHKGLTPASVTLKASAGYFKGESYTITFSKEGHAEKSITLRSSVDGWYFGNILLGGLIGMLIVDPATGAMYSLPKHVDVGLPQTVSAQSQEQLTIASISSIDDVQKSHLVRIN